MNIVASFCHIRLQLDTSTVYNAYNLALSPARCKVSPIELGTRHFRAQIFRLRVHSKLSGSKPCHVQHVTQDAICTVIASVSSLEI